MQQRASEWACQLEPISQCSPGIDTWQLLHDSSMPIHAACKMCTLYKPQVSDAPRQHCRSLTDSRAFPIYPLNMLAQSFRAASSIFDRAIQSALRKLAHDGLACAIKLRCGALPNNLALHTQSRQHVRFSIHLAATIFRSSDPCACNMVILSAADKCFQRLADA